MAVTDNFNRSDENPLGNGNWSTGFGHSAMRIVSNQCLTASSGADSTSYYSGLTFNNDQSGQITHSTIGDGGITLRQQTGAKTFYVVRVLNTLLIGVYECTAGSYAILGSSIDGTYANGDIIKATITGSTIEVFQNGSSKGTRTDATITSGYPGLWGYNTSLRLDDWEATGEIAGGPTSHALSGQVDTVSNTAAGLIAALLLGAASVATASVATGALTAGSTLNGQAATVSTSTGDLTVGAAFTSHALSGQADTVSAATGQLIEGLTLRAQSDTISTASGDLTVGGAVVSHALSGQADTVSTTSGSAAAGLALSGQADTVSTATGALALGHPLTGTAATVSTATGTGLIAGHGLTGQADTTSTATGTVGAGYVLSGQAATVSTTSAELSGGTAVVWQNFVSDVREPRKALTAESKASPRRALEALYTARAALSATWRGL